MNKPLTRAEWLEYLDTTWKKCLHEAWDKEWEDMKNDAMTFDQWWATLTPKEQLVLGRNNAQFVWNCALDSCASILDKNAMACDNPIYRSLLQANADAIKEEKSK